MSARDLATRQITKNISTLQLSVIGFMATIPAGILSLTLSGSVPTVPTGLTLIYLAGAISIGVPALYCIISAMRIGDIAFISPFRYSRIIFGLLAGLLVFGETLDGYTLLGAAIIVASGTFTLWREARLRRASQTSPSAV
jgi:drug/metabolite transporter (DMT)-like permease